jgi:hypothetical protein
MTILTLLAEESEGKVDETIIEMEHAIEQLKKYGMCGIKSGRHTITINHHTNELLITYNTDLTL